MQNGCKGEINDKKVNYCSGFIHHNNADYSDYLWQYFHNNYMCVLSSPTNIIIDSPND